MKTVNVLGLGRKRKSDQDIGVDLLLSKTTKTGVAFGREKVPNRCPVDSEGKAPELAVPKQMGQVNISTAVSIS